MMHFIISQSRLWLLSHRPLVSIIRRSLLFRELVFSALNLHSPLPCCTCNSYSMAPRSPSHSVRACTAWLTTFLVNNIRTHFDNSHSVVVIALRPLPGLSDVPKLQELFSLNLQTSGPMWFLEYGENNLWRSA